MSYYLLFAAPCSPPTPHSPECTALLTYHPLRIPEYALHYSHLAVHSSLPARYSQPTAHRSPALLTVHCLLVATHLLRLSAHCALHTTRYVPGTFLSATFWPIVASRQTMEHVWHTIECKLTSLPTAHCSLLTTYHLQLTSHYSSPTACHSLPTLQTVHSSLLTLHSSLLTPYCTLLTCYCTLFTTHYPLLTTHYSTTSYSLLTTSY